MNKNATSSRFQLPFPELVSFQDFWLSSNPINFTQFLLKLPICLKPSSGSWLQRPVTTLGPSCEHFWLPGQGDNTIGLLKLAPDLGLGPPYGGLVREIPVFQGSGKGWWNIIIWPLVIYSFSLLKTSIPHLWKRKIIFPAYFLHRICSSPEGIFLQYAIILNHSHDIPSCNRPHISWLDNPSIGRFPATAC